MIVYEFKLKGKEFQLRIVDEMIRTAAVAVCQKYGVALLDGQPRHQALRLE